MPEIENVVKETAVQHMLDGLGSAVTPEVGNRSRNQLNKGDESRMSKETSATTKRKRGFYDLPDLDELLNLDIEHTHLTAPPPRVVDGKQMVQRWIDCKKDNGAHIMWAVQRGGWAIRDPKTVQGNFPFQTNKWDGHDVIMCGQELILCETTKDFYDYRQAKKIDKNQERLEAADRRNDFIEAGKTVNKSANRGYDLVRTSVDADRMEVYRGGNRETNFAND